MMATAIRPRTDKDLVALSKVLAEVYELDGYPVEGVNDPLAWLALPNPIGAWTAELDGRPVGHVALTEPTADDEAPRLFARQIGPEPTAVLGRLFVAPAARGRGVAGQLATVAMRAATFAGRRAVLDVMQKDRLAIRLYERLGWCVLGEFSHRYGDNQSATATAMTAPSAQR